VGNKGKCLFFNPVNMKTESMVNEAIQEELKNYESEKKMTEEEMAGIKGGKAKDPATIRDTDMPTEMVKYSNL